VISDLHIGDRSPRDNLCRARRERRLQDFLDYVEDERGQLVIAGDLFELLRYPLDSIIDRRSDLLDRFAAMGTTYLPGNHDEEVVSLINPKNPPHPFFAGMSEDFVRAIGGRRFKFAHGHLGDPLVTASLQNLGRMIGTVRYRFELRRAVPGPSADLLAQGWSPLGGRGVPLRYRLRQEVTRAYQQSRYRTAAERVRMVTREFRSRRMLTCFHGERIEDLYDVAIAGHTHSAGTVGDWYFNSGSWTAETNDYLRIQPDGKVDVFEWNHLGPQRNKAILAA